MEEKTFSSQTIISNYCKDKGIELIRDWRKGRLNAKRFAPTGLFLAGAGLVPADPESGSDDYQAGPSQDLIVDGECEAVEPIKDLVSDRFPRLGRRPDTVIVGKNDCLDLVEHKDAKADKEQHLTHSFPVHVFLLWNTQGRKIVLERTS